MDGETTTESESRQPRARIRIADLRVLGSIPADVT